GTARLMNHVSRFELFLASSAVDSLPRVLFFAVPSVTPWCNESSLRPSRWILLPSPLRPLRPLRCVFFLFFVSVSPAVSSFSAVNAFEFAVGALRGDTDSSHVP